MEHEKFFKEPDSKTWTDVLSKNLDSAFDNLWMNNAGIDGHSTFGHIILIRLLD